MKPYKLPTAFDWADAGIALLKFVALIGFMFCMVSPLAVYGPYLLLLALVIFHLSGLLHSWGHFKIAIESADRPTPRKRRTWFRLWMESRGFVLPSFVVLMVTYGHQWRLPEIGFSTQTYWPWQVVVGVVTAFVFLRVLSGIYAKIYQRRSTHNKRLDTAVLRQNIPRGAAAQALSLLNSVVLMPIAEEVVQRGFFVYFAGGLVGTVWSIFFGLLICLGIHLYQGYHRLLSVAMFYAVTVALLYSPWGLVAAIVFHSVCNARYVVTLARRARWHMYELRRRRDLASHGTKASGATN